ncbi:MAG: hypothetical protein AAB798_01295 [Patescibacteria group bacterium]
MSEMLGNESIQPPTPTVIEAFGGEIDKLNQEEKRALDVLLALFSHLNPNKIYDISDLPTLNLNVKPIISNFKIIKSGIPSNFHLSIVDQATGEKLFQLKPQHIHSNNKVIQIIVDKLKMRADDHIKYGHN